MAREENKNFRNELKYEISGAELVNLRNRLDRLIPPDVHGGKEGSYRIRSLYFDDYENRCFYENENGTDPREKFRIRIYNSSSDRIMLECKRKERGKTLKTTCPLTEAQTRLLMAGKPVPDIGRQHPVLRKLTMLMLTRRMKPAVIVEYDRVAYVYPHGNVRITLDMNISSSRDIGCFLGESISKRPIMPRGRQLLEVKFDGYLPDFIYHSLQLSSLNQTAFSKYYLCRKYTR